ncbi:hypothetical protein HZH66_013294 [Vespula vulgaris]|uniref:Uncharacterized protein n=1 Tax=Vespula vulgaris TaxID=7454 RepID=A0A834MRP8_VESVU|nr:hypothetical protein HZH66_013294 [Vespula vulgaris]
MYLRSCTLCFLILIVTCCNGNFTEYVGVTSELVSVENLMFVGQDTSYVSSKVNINKIFDEILPKIRDFLIKNGLEPINLPNYTENILINGKIDLRNGFLHYMTDVKRSKNVMLQYRYKHIFLEIPLRWQLLDFNYNYDFTYLFIKKRGEAYGRVEDADFIVTLEIDLNKFQVILQEIKIHRIEVHSGYPKVLYRKEKHNVTMILSHRRKIRNFVLENSILRHFDIWLKRVEEVEEENEDEDEEEEDEEEKMKKKKK